MTVPAHANSLRHLVREDGVASMWCNRREILRRIFVTVRDSNWQEIAPAHWESEINETQHTATLTARHVSDSVDFEWRGSLHVSEDHQYLRFQITGRVLRDMEVCRVGLVVLHPVESLVGSRLTAMGVHSTHRLCVGPAIAPQPVVNGIPGAMTEPFSRLIVEREDLGRLELQFDGDLFELEDQRNWGDASFKIYCTPLRLGFPRGLKARETITQSVEMRFVPGSENEDKPGTPSDTCLVLATRRVRNVEDRHATLTGVFPKVGRDLTPSSGKIIQAASQPGIRWHHLHFDVEGAGSVDTLRTLLASAASPKIEIGLEAEDDEPSTEVLGLLSKHRERISRLLLYGSYTSLPSAEAVEHWRRALQESGAQPAVPLLLGTRGYFVEFNRDVVLNEAASGIAFPLTATVHSDDAATIADNVATIRYMADTARNRLGAAEIAARPLALYYPQRDTSVRFPGELVVPWLVATLINAALARVGSVTLSEDALDAIRSNGPTVLSLLSRLVDCERLEVTPLNEKISAGLHAAVFKTSAAERNYVLAANLTPQAIVVPLPKGLSPVNRVTNAVTGDSAELNTEYVSIPGLGVSWIG